MEFKLRFDDYLYIYNTINNNGSIIYIDDKNCEFYHFDEVMEEFIREPYNTTLAIHMMINLLIYPY